MTSNVSSLVLPQLPQSSHPSHPPSYAHPQLSIFKLFESRYIKELNSYQRDNLPTAEQRKQIYWANVCRIYKLINTRDFIISYNIEKLITQFDTTIKKTIDNLKNPENENHKINFLLCHGSPVYSFFKVPENLIICFLTPLNRFSHQDNNEFIYIKNTLINKKENILTNLECFQDNDPYAYDMFKYATFYYPGQMCTETKFSKNKPQTDLKFAILASGLYKNINNATKPDKIVDAGIILSQLIAKNTLTGLLVINCCRSCNNTLISNQIQILYQYEHFINVANMSLRFNDEEKYNNCSADVTNPAIYVLKENINLRLDNSNSILKNSSLSPLKKTQFRENIKKIYANLQSLIKAKDVKYDKVYQTMYTYINTLYIFLQKNHNQDSKSNLLNIIIIYLLKFVNIEQIMSFYIYYIITQFDIIKKNNVNNVFFDDDTFENIIYTKLISSYADNKHTTFTIYLQNCEITIFKNTSILSELFIYANTIYNAINSDAKDEDAKIKVNFTLYLNNNSIDSDEFLILLKEIYNSIHTHKVNFTLDLSNNKIEKIDYFILDYIITLKTSLKSLNLKNNNLKIEDYNLDFIKREPFLNLLLIDYLPTFKIITNTTFYKRTSSNNNNNVGLYNNYVPLNNNYAGGFLKNKTKKKHIGNYIKKQKTKRKMPSIRITKSRIF
uniref:Uncharacterized protein n=1 Tax=viral metagenome TaxID=1070528 RepID=A0A6C0HMN9_9ZZZZ